jgi:Gas vesicle synthesis protein GvpO
MASSTSRSSSTKKSTKRASPAKKSTGGSTTKKATGGTSRAQKSSEGSGSSSSPRKAPKAEARRPARAGQVAAQAAAELLELTGKGAEGVTGLERTEDGWTVQVEVVEVRRIPDTTDVLALYEVQTDDQGSLQGYRRIRRYARGVPGEN